MTATEPETDVARNESLESGELTNPQNDADAKDTQFDRELAISLAQAPFIAVGWVLLAWAASAITAALGWGLTTQTAAGQTVFHNLGPLYVLAFGMILAAFIDGYAFKVPNWCTLSIVVSGWYIGIMHDLGIQIVPGAGGTGAALAGTAIGFALMFFPLMIGGMGQGDVKMTMAYGSWIFAYFGISAGWNMLWWAFAIGVITGGVFAIVMMVLRRQFSKNLSNAKEIVADLNVMVEKGPEAAATRATTRRPEWVRLPYGVPLCVGFVGYPAYVILFQH